MTSRFEVLPCQQNLPQFLIFDLISESVTTQEEKVAFLKSPLLHLYLEMVATAYRARDNMSQTVSSSLFSCDDSLSELFLDQGVILGQLAKFFIPEEVKTAIANVRPEGLVTSNPQCNQG